MELYFSQKEKEDFLTKLGYEVKETRVTMSEPCYHNDVHTWKAKVDGVFKDGVAYRKPCYRSFKKTEWVDQVFARHLKKRLLKLLLEPSNDVLPF